MKWPILRDVVLFLGGLAGVIHETALSHAERPTLLVLFAAMMGLPAFLQSEVKPRWKANDADEDKPKKSHGDDTRPDHSEFDHDAFEKWRKAQKRRHQ